MFLKGEAEEEVGRRSGGVNANLGELNEEARLPYIADLIARKQSGENSTLADGGAAFHQREYERLSVVAVCP